jgi:hypothetical protein
MPCHAPGLAPEMLAFDIETLGLNPQIHDVTCVCAEDFHTGRKYVFEYARVKKESPGDREGLTAALVKLFDDASSLCAFNGIRFDLPFMEKALGIPADTVTKWKKKTSDILEKCREVYKHTFKLDLLCECNDIQTKSASGLQAIEWAREERWEELKEYCAMDVHILCDLYRKRVLVNPRNQKNMDLKEWTNQDVYKEDILEEATRTTLKRTGSGVFSTCSSPTKKGPWLQLEETEAGSTEGVEKKTLAPPPEACEGVTERHLDILLAISRRQRRLSEVKLKLRDLFGVQNQFAVCRCPLCDQEGFIQDDTQCIGTDMDAVKDMIFTCGMQHAYRVSVEDI